MRTKALLITVIICLFTGITFSQDINYNLKNLVQLKIVINDNQNIFSSALYQKILTETKLKLMSAGIKIANEDAEIPILEIKPNYIKSILSEHRIILQLRLIENVSTNRKGNIKTEALTYFDMEYFTSQDVSNAVYNKLMDSTLIRFIEQYLNQNGD